MTYPVPQEDCHIRNAPAAEPTGEGSGSDPDTNDTGKIDKGL